jgi:hypothetical protein
MTLVASLIEQAERFLPQHVLDARANGHTWHEIAQALDTSPDDALLAEHVDDGRGYCRACTLGAQRGYHRHPCNIRCTAERARRIERN